MAAVILCSSLAVLLFALSPALNPRKKTRKKNLRNHGRNGANLQLAANEQEPTHLIQHLLDEMLGSRNQQQQHNKDHSNSSYSSSTLENLVEKLQEENNQLREEVIGLTCGSCCSKNEPSYLHSKDSRERNALEQENQRLLERLLFLSTKIDELKRLLNNRAHANPEDRIQTHLNSLDCSNNCSDSTSSILEHYVGRDCSYLYVPSAGVRLPSFPYDKQFQLLQNDKRSEEYKQPQITGSQGSSQCENEDTLDFLNSTARHFCTRRDEQMTTLSTEKDLRQEYKRLLCKINEMAVELQAARDENVHLREELKKTCGNKEQIPKRMELLETKSTSYGLNINSFTSRDSVRTLEPFTKYKKSFEQEDVDLNNLPRDISEMSGNTSLETTRERSQPLNEESDNLSVISNRIQHGLLSKKSPTDEFFPGRFRHF